jgi:hypothetical protein
MVIQSTVSLAVHGQPVWVETLIVPLPPADVKAREIGLIA